MLKDIPIKSPELLKILDRWVDIPKIAGWEDNVHVWCPEHNNKEAQEKWTGDGYLKKLIEVEGDRHEGFPDYMVARNFKPSDRTDKNVIHQSFERDSNPEVREKIWREIQDINDDMMFFLGTRNNALCAYYPPGGYISWHTNWNAPGYNLIFSWSENGDGWFKARDPNTGQIITYNDKPGWQLKAGYFGHLGERDKICYHAASTNCNRITVSFLFSDEDMAMDLQDDVIAEISQE